MNSETWLAIYGATVATLTGVWQIVSVYRDKAVLIPKAQLSIPVGPNVVGPTSLSITVVNKGRRPVTVSGCGLRLTDNKLASYLARPGELPHRLEEGESFRVDQALEEVKLELVKAEVRAQKVWVRDSTDKVYLQRLPKNIKEALTTKP